MTSRLKRRSIRPLSLRAKALIDEYYCLDGTVKKISLKFVTFESKELLRVGRKTVLVIYAFVEGEPVEIKLQAVVILQYFLAANRGFGLRLAIERIPKRYHDILLTIIKTQGSSD